MRRIVFSGSAIGDLQDIFRHIAIEKGERAIGRRLVDELKRKCVHLAGLSGQVGRPRPELGDRVRSLSYLGHVLLFVYEPDDLFQVVAIIHGSRDLPVVFEGRS